MSLPTAFVGVFGCCVVIAVPFALASLSPAVVTREGFEALRGGMTLTEAERTIGHAGEVRVIEEIGTERRHTVVWLNADGSSVSVVFARGALASKTAERLP